VAEHGGIIPVLWVPMLLAAEDLFGESLKNTVIHEYVITARLYVLGGFVTPA